MKIILNLLATVFTLSILSSCEKSDIKFESDFQKSQKAWTSFKNTSNNSYQYTVVGGSWVGFGLETKLTVKNGIVIERYYKYTPAPDSEEAVKEWTEDQGNLNSHENSGAAAAITLDKVYEKAEQDWLLKRKDAKTYFEVNEEGLISLSGYVPNNCADDCFMGISISKIIRLNSSFL